MGYFRGKDRFLRIKKNGIFVPVGCLIDNSLVENTEFIGTTTRENAGWSTKKPVKQGYSVSFAGLQLLGGDPDTYVSYVELKQLKRLRVLVEWDLVLTSGDTTVIDRGKAYISDISEAAPVGDWLSFNGTLEGFGTPTLLNSAENSIFNNTFKDTFL